MKVEINLDTRPGKPGRLIVSGRISGIQPLQGPDQSNMRVIFLLIVVSLFHAHFSHIGSYFTRYDYIFDFLDIHTT